MSPFSVEVWLLLAAVAAATLLAILHCLSITVRNEAGYYILKERASRIREQMGAHFASQRADAVIVVDEAPPEDMAA
ncbi:MAG: hypothetical protein ACKVW3_08400 [Phycisphaerales bacterium]